jgi:hypothetical protein
MGVMPLMEVLRWRGGLKARSYYMGINPARKRIGVLENAELAVGK